MLPADSATDKILDSYSRLGVDAAQFQGPSHSIDGHDVSSDAIAHAVRFRGAHHLVEALIHDVLQALVHFALASEKSLAILYPFKVTDRDATGISENVGNHKDSLLVDNFIGVRGDRAVRAFTQNLAINAAGILGGDLILSGCWYQNVGGMKQNILRGLLIA